MVSKVITRAFLGKEVAIQVVGRRAHCRMSNSMQGARHALGE